MRVLAIALAVVIGAASVPGHALARQSGPLGVVSAATPCDSPGSPTVTAYLPNVTKSLGGPTGWQTPFIVQNVGLVPTVLEVSFYGFASGTLIACRRIAGVAAATSYADVPNNDADLPGDTQFSVVVRSFGAPIVAVVNEQAGTGDRSEALSYVGLTSGATTIGLPFIAKHAAGWLTTFIVQNVGSSTAHVSATFSTSSGAHPAALSRVIEPGRSQFVDPTVERSIDDGFEYSVVVTSDQPVGVVVNAHRDGPDSPAPMAFSYNGVAPTSDSAYLPYVARNTDGIGRQTRIFVQNVGAGDATPQLTFRSAGASSDVTVTAPAPVRSGRVWTYDPRMQADGITACPPAGASTCPAEGESAASVTGGRFAVIAAVTSPTTAMGYSAQAPSPSRVYLPNVTRTLGGPAGWTTPIVIQSAGATAATLHWYRFSDGALVQVQQLTDLRPGAPVRVDPRSVAGLPENSQYAVVVDGRGPLTAVVAELNASGGDAAMLYEGFASTQSASPVPTRVVVTPAAATVAPGATQQFTAAVSDQFDGPLTGLNVSWTITPPSFGTITAAGVFTAASTPGKGTITAQAGGVAGSATVTVELPTTATVGGISFAVAHLSAVDLYTELAISTSDRQMLAASITADVQQLEAHLLQQFRQRVAVYVIATSAEFSQAVTTIGGAGIRPSEWAPAFCVCYDLTAQKVLVDWQRVAGTAGAAVTRHELTHALEQQIAGGGIIPAWLNEGTARLEEFTVSGFAWEAMQDRYEAASMAKVGTLLTLTDLTSQATWNARSEPQASYQYMVASQAVQLLRNDIGIPGEVSLLRRLGSGEDFETAFMSVTGRQLAAFAAGLPDRMRSAAATYPGAATSTDTPIGPGLSWIFYGLPPQTTFTLSILGPNVRNGGSPVRTTDANGASFGAIGSLWPAGSYSITATWAGGAVSVSAVKAASVTDDGNTASVLLLDGLPTWGDASGKHSFTSPTAP